MSKMLKWLLQNLGAVLFCLSMLFLVVSIGVCFGSVIWIAFQLIWCESRLHYGLMEKICLTSVVVAVICFVICSITNQWA
jgi:hypothetical protein